jgi:hypothetical protein
MKSKYYYIQTIMKSDSASFGRQFLNLLQNKHILIKWAAIVLLGYLPKWVENLCLHKNLHVNVYKTLLKIGKTWMWPRFHSVGEWINYGPSNGVLLNEKNANTPWVHLETNKLKNNWGRREIHLCRRIPNNLYTHSLLSNR